MIDIIIVKYNNAEYENETIQQVLSTVKQPYHLTVYENFYDDENLSKVWNDLIRNSKAEYVILLNNDTVPHPNWSEKLVEIFEDDKVGAVGAVSNRAGGYQGGHKGPHKDGTIQEVTQLSGFCMAIRKSAWEKVGGFDERYKLYGEDSQFCVDLKKSGYKLMLRFDTFVYHHKAKSQAIAEAKGKDIEAIKRESQALFHKVNKQSSL